MQVRCFESIVATVPAAHILSVPKIHSHLMISTGDRND